jgi:dTDP-glucose 4,6-dehydratase
MNVLITGGAGFIGSRFAEMLVNEEIVNPFASITVVDKLTYSGNKANLDGIMENSRFQFEQADICDEIAIKAILIKHKITHIVNFAAESHVDRSIESSKAFYETNVMGTRNLLDLARSNSVVRFVQVSTDEVYGSINEGSWEEDQPLDPSSPYSSSKAGADLMVSAYFKTHNMNVGITRCSNNYGLRQFPEKVIPRFITNLIQGKKIPIYGEGLQVREWIHVDDHCRGIYLVLEKGEPGEVYNIGGEVEMPNIELARRLIREFNLNEEDTFEFVEDRKGHDFRYSLTGNKIKQELGFKSQTNFDEEIIKLIKWYKENQSWWEPLLDKR